MCIGGGGHFLNATWKWNELALERVSRRMGL